MAKTQTLKILDERALRKKYKDRGSIASDLVLNSESSLWLPCRNLSLNYQLGGGIPYGKILELFGYESTGKTLLAKDFAYAAQSLGGVVLWDDAEGSFDLAWAEKNGIDLDRIELYEENDVEGMSDWLRDMTLYYRSKLTNNEPILFVCDSIAALECAENINSDQVQSKAEMGNRAKAIYRFYRKRNSGIIKKYGVCCIMINQVRDKVGASMFEDSTTTPGGAATKFYASQRVGLIRSKQIKGLVKNGEFKSDLVKGHKIGQNIIVRIEKNKCAPPRPNIKTSVYFLDEMYGYVGYDRYAGLDILGLDDGIIKKQGNTYTVKGEKLAGKRDDIVKGLHTNPKARKRVLRKLGINTISKAREKIENTSVNLYPVKLKQSEDEE